MQLAKKLFGELRSSPHDHIIYHLLRGGDNGYDALSPKQLHNLSCDLSATILKALSGERIVLIAMNSSLEFIVAMTACIYSGITFIPVPLPKTKNDATRISRIIEDCSVCSVLCRERELNYFENIELPGNQLKCIAIEPVQLTDNANEEWRPIQFQPHQSDTVVIQYTSGSTYHPKGVLINEKNILNNHQQVAQCWRLSQEKVVLSWLPHFHDMGLFGGLIYPLLSGMKTIKMSPEDFIKKPSRWLAAIDHFKVYCSGGPAFAFEICLDVITDKQLHQWDLSSWQVAFCGADYVPASLLPRFRTKMKVAGLNPEAVLACYGLAESTLFVGGQRCWNHTIDGVNAEERILPNFKSEGCYIDSKNLENIKIVDLKTNREVFEGNEGEVCIAGASVTRGYRNVKIDSILLNGQSWLKTGDIGCIRKQCLFITGRIKDMIVIHGKNIFPNDIALSVFQLNENLNPHASAVFREKNSPNRFIFLIERKNRQNIELEKELAEVIKTHIQQQFGITITQAHILKRGALPKTSSGKVRRSDIERNHQFMGII